MISRFAGFFSFTTKSLGAVHAPSEQVPMARVPLSAWIVSVATTVARLVIVASGGEGGVAREVGKGAADRCRSRVIDHRKDSAISQSLVCYWLKTKFRSCLDGYSFWRLPGQHGHC